MNDTELQIKTLADRLLKQGISNSHLDARRMASSMIEGSSKLTSRSSQVLETSSVPNGLASVAPEEKYKQQLTGLQEQVMVAQGRIAAFEQQQAKDQQQISELQSQLEERNSQLQLAQAALEEARKPQQQEIESPQENINQIMQQPSSDIVQQESQPEEAVVEQVQPTQHQEPQENHAVQQMQETPSLADVFASGQTIDLANQESQPVEEVQAPKEQEEGFLGNQMKTESSSYDIEF